MHLLSPLFHPRPAGAVNVKARSKVAAPRGLDLRAPIVAPSDQAAVCEEPVERREKTGSSSKKILEISQAEFHRCLAHRSYKAARNLILNEHATGVEFTDDAPFDKQCDVCIQAKITRKAIPQNAHPAEHDLVVTKYGEKFHSDTWDANATLLGGNAKSVLFVDDKTRYHHGFPLKSNADTDEAYLELEASVLTQTGNQAKWLHSDNGSEFIGLQPHMLKRGMYWSASALHTPEQTLPRLLCARPAPLQSICACLLQQPWKAPRLAALLLLLRWPGGALGPR